MSIDLTPEQLDEFYSHGRLSSNTHQPLYQEPKFKNRTEQLAYERAFKRSVRRHRNQFPKWRHLGGGNYVPEDNR